jgi:hypothetical protein
MGTVTIWLGTVIAFALVGTALVTGYLWFLGLSEREVSIERW